MAESIGAINVSGMIWTSTILTLGALWICYYTTPVENPTILESAMEYPYTIIFRVGMMYSLFIMFLELFFIKWWLDSMTTSKHTRKITIIGAIGLAAYGLFVSCIDRKRLNYALAENSVFLSAICTSIAIYSIMKNLKNDRLYGHNLTSEKSWILKKLFSLVHLCSFIWGGLIFFGFMDITQKWMVEYLMVISTILFFWTFTIDFKKFKMDVEKIPHKLPGEV